MQKLAQKPLHLTPSWLAKIFGRPRRVLFTDSSVEIIGDDGQCVDTLEYSSASSFPRLSRGLFSDIITFSFSGEPYTVGYLKKSDVRANWNRLCQIFAPHLGIQIDSAYKRIIHLTDGQFLKESQISELEKLSRNCLERFEAFERQYFSNDIQASINHIEALTPVSERVHDIRRAFEQNQLKLHRSFFDKAESNPLTLNQRQAIVRNNDFNLVLAAAGTGKTSVIVAKALDLIANRQINPNDILILAYNNAAAKELRERLELRGNLIGIDTLPQIYTFHAFGRELLKQANVPVKMSVFSEDTNQLFTWVTSWLITHLKSDISILQNVLSMVFLPVNPFNFKSKEEYEKFVRDTEYRTLNNELVKGYQELLIANWLFINGIAYEYEPKYVSKRRLEEGVDYKPDFYLIKADIYLEHFGIARDGSTREDIDREKYNAEIVRKRELHKSHETTLIETYHYDWVEGNLENRLLQLMHEHGVKISPLPAEQLFDKLNASGAISNMAEILFKSLQAIRVEHLNKQEIVTRIKPYNAEHAEWCGEFLMRLLAAYENELRAQDAIDFDDMITLAQKHVRDEAVKASWQHILVDEFQDISTARLNLVKALISRAPGAILTAVGDDWQSIYRFSGGKLEITTRFAEHLGSFTQTTLDKTFRYNNSIAHTAGAFVMKNPEQHKKQIITHEQTSDSQVYLLDTFVDGNSSPEQKVSLVVSRIKKQDPKATVAVISRYNYILHEVDLKLKENNLSSKVKLWTFHKSKGLEADYCILVGFFQGKTGFPNENHGNYMVEALLPSLDGYPHSEERRLLYVGLTRARKKCYLIADPRGISSFIQELLSPVYNVHVASAYFEEEYQKIFKCTKCSDGFLRLHKGEYGSFYRCTSGIACKVKPRVCGHCHAPMIDKMHSSICNNPACRSETPICDKCGRPMKKRNGKFGAFLGCTGYGIKEDQCKNTRKWFL